MSYSLTADELNALIEVGKTVSGQLDLAAVLESIMAVTTEVMNVEASSLILLDDETGDLVFHVAHGARAEAVKPLRMLPGEGIAGRVIQSGQPAVVNDVSQDAGFCERIDKTSGFQTKAILCVPLTTRKRLWGALEILNKVGDARFDDHDLQLCEALAAQAAIAIEIATLHKRILDAERLAAVGEAISGVAHCVKNVLNCVRSGLYIVELGLGKTDLPMIEKGWDMLKRNNGFLEDLVLDMLTYSKERQPEYATTDLNEILRETCESLTDKAERGGVAVQWTQNDALRKVILDPKGIRRCLLNLVSNAIEACSGRESARVNVGAETEDSLLHIRVSDNGCGISEEAKAKLFQVFFSTKGSRGTGLGLPVTHKIVTEHGGKIVVDSVLGQGTTFTIALPLKREPGVT